MPLTVICPSCKAKLKAPDNLVGKAVKCPGCGSAVLVKAVAAAAPAAAPKAIAKPKTAPPPPKRPQALDEIEPVDEVEDVEDYEEDVPKAAKGKKASALADADRGPVSDNEKLMGLLVHVSMYLINIVLPGMGWLGPIGIWVVKRKESAFIDHHGKEWLNFAISMFVLMLVLGIVLGGLGVGLLFVRSIWWVGAIFLGLLGFIALCVSLYMFVMHIIVGFKAKKGEWARYKCLFRVFK
jgi:uncharacterized Tic20 family protein/DNA-directed RNA polymerase subunit RPC12/RpoP